jgi:hypothetical protein
MSWLIAGFIVLPISAAAVDREALVKDLIKLSGLEQQIKQIPQQVLIGFEKDGKKLPPAQYQTLRRMLNQSFNPVALQTHVHKRLRAELDPVVAKKSLEWLKSDLGRRITKLEEAASTPQALKELQGYAAHLKASPPSQERLTLARQVDFATHATENNVEIIEASTFSIAAAMDATLPQDKRQGQDRLRILTDRQRPKWREASQDMTLVSLLYTYQRLTDQELERYVEFLETDIGRQYNNAASDALKDALYVAIERMSQRLTDILAGSSRKVA